MNCRFVSRVSFGRFSLQRSVASQQRVWKGQPGGGRRGDGTLPVRMIRSPCRLIKDLETTTAKRCGNGRRRYSLEQQTENRKLLRRTCRLTWHLPPRLVFRLQFPS